MKREPRRRMDRGPTSPSIPAFRPFRTIEVTTRPRSGLHTEYRFDTVIASGARGADVLAVEWAQARGIATQVFNVRSGTFGGRAFLLRNARLLAEGRPDLVIAFPGVGTADVVRQAKAAGIWVLIESHGLFAAPRRYAPGFR